MADCGGKNKEIKAQAKVFGLAFSSTNLFQARSLKLQKIKPSGIPL
jgi:hypothetical protein